MTDAAAQVRIIIADDHHVVRTGLTAPRDTRADFTVVGTACDGDIEATLRLRAEADA